MKIGLQYAFHPTPAKVASGANVIFIGLGGTTALVSLLAQYPRFALGFMIVCLVFKGFANCCTDDENAGQK